MIETRHLKKKIFFQRIFKNTFVTEHLWMNVFCVLLNTCSRQTLFEIFVQKQELVIGSFSFNKNPLTLYAKILIRSGVEG